MKTIVKPMHDFVLLERYKSEAPASSTLVIPESAERPSQKFRVVAVGPGRVVKGERIPMEVKAGDDVILGNYSFVEVVFEGRTVHMVPGQDILAVVAS